MKFQTFFLNEIFFIEFQRTAIHIAVEKGNQEIIKELLGHQELDVNAKLISI